MNAAQAFANALNTLRLYARNFDPTRGLPPPCYLARDEQARIWAEFQKRAVAWRALPAKPPISDDVKQHRLLAEDAYQQKQFDTAAAEYEAGLEIDPLWAQGHFNAAVIYGELKDYDDAVWHMRCYLELVPDAPDAQESRDQMLLWQGKAKQQVATQ
jgi:tetratricopeptide (TPR) repeat protein